VVVMNFHLNHRKLGTQDYWLKIRGRFWN